jgi:hypothetical protein
MERTMFFPTPRRVIASSHVNLPICCCRIDSFFYPRIAKRERFMSGKRNRDGLFLHGKNPPPRFQSVLPQSNLEDRSIARAMLSI